MRRRCIDTTHGWAASDRAGRPDGAASRKRPQAKARAFAVVVVASLTLGLAHLYDRSKPIYDRSEPTGVGPMHPIWALDRADAITLNTGTAAATAFRAYEKAVPRSVCVGALVGNDDPSYPLYDTGLSRRVVYLPRLQPRKAAERAHLSWVVIGPHASRRAFAAAREWRRVRLGPGWLLATRATASSSCRS